MFDFSENMTKNLKKSIPVLERTGFRYLSTEGHSFLKTISDNLMMAIEQNKKSFSASSDKTQENNDKKWVSILNSKENWARFKKNKTSTGAKDIDMLNQFWESQNQFALSSNQSLVESLEVILFCLTHVQAALKEYEKNAKNRRNADKKFIKIHSLNERLKSLKRQLTNAMLVRLKISHHYSNRRNQQISNVDDVIYYISNSLNTRNALNSDEQKILPTKPRQTLAAESKSLFQQAVSGNYYVKFYDSVKMHGESQEEQNQIDAFHWSKIINHPVFHLSNSTSKHGSIISIPTFLYKFAPKEYQTPSLWYWQSNAILKFWEKRQDFLVNLNHLWVYANSTNHQKSLTKDENIAKKEKCIALINDELSKIGKENPSFFAFNYKEMLKEWELILKSMRTELLQSIRNIESPIQKPVTCKNMNHENKKEDPAKKEHIRENQPFDISQLIKEREEEYQDFASDDEPVQLAAPKISVNVDSGWKGLKGHAYVSAREASHFSINGTHKDLTLNKKITPRLSNRITHPLPGRIY